ncbi:hypothetical protein EG68_06619 [Paragonimus skrjabini miyazakii]|uniref:dolichyl-diphosphooligosaccharide--protein glycotransferase n=1 Tax=Paragonimus skrjabini miyazakii TaxID=59628 RepID=A0A8S9YZI4_9TREM|nr:hypothetical protein EG68_06619 [Paragonimus skrjabini miyazakii]
MLRCKMRVYETEALGVILEYGFLLSTSFLGFAIRCFSVIRHGIFIHEFDPWFNFRITELLKNKRNENIVDLFDDMSWYPLGAPLGSSIYPGLMFISNLLHTLLINLGINIKLWDLCALLPPSFNIGTILVSYVIATSIWDKTAGLLCAFFISIVPGNIPRSISGSFDYEAISIPLFLSSCYFWILSLTDGRIIHGLLSVVTYVLLSYNWGGYVIVLNLFALHVCLLCSLRYCNMKVYVAYGIFYTLGSLCASQLPVVGFKHYCTVQHLLALCCYLGMQFCFPFGNFSSTLLERIEFVTLVSVTLTVAAVVTFLSPLFGLQSAWERLLALLDMAQNAFGGTARSMLAKSVMEHHPQTWSNFFHELHVLLVFFPVGVWLCIKRLTSGRLFIVNSCICVLGLTCFMSRLSVLLTPFVCILSAVGVSETFRVIMNTQCEKVKKSEEKQNWCLVNANLSVVQHSNKKRMKMRVINERSSAHSYHQRTRNVVWTEYLLRTGLICIFVYVFLLFILHCIFVISKTYSNSWIILDGEADDGHTITVDDFRETYYWIRQNTPGDARIFAWWHYGYHLNAMGKRTTFVDNHTWNSTHIALVARAFLSNETRAYQLLSKMEADYVLIVSGCMASYPLDDVSNMQWMAQIAEEVFPKEITARNYLNGKGMISIGHEAKRSVLESLMYKLSYFRYHEVNLGPHIPTGFDNTRNEQIGRKYTKDSLEHFEEAYTSQNWLLRLYKVLTLNNRISL